MVRGRHEPQVTMLAFIDLETRVPPDHPLRVIKKLADQALKALSPDLDRMYADVGRPSIPPERLLKSSLLIALYSVRSERGFCEQLDYNLLFRKTLGGDKAYDTGDCVAVLRRRGVTPHVARSTNGRSSAIDGRTTRHPGYAISQRIRKRVEEIFGWMKTVGGFRRTRYKGLDRTGLAGYLVATAYNLVRMAKLLELAKEAPKAQAA